MVVTPVIALPAVVLRVVPEVKNVPVVEPTPVTTVVLVVVHGQDGQARSVIQELNVVGRITGDGRVIGTKHGVST